MRIEIRVKVLANLRALVDLKPKTRKNVLNVRQIPVDAPGKVGNQVEIDGHFAFKDLTPLSLSLPFEAPLGNHHAKKEGQSVNQIPVVGPSLLPVAMKEGVESTLDTAARTVQGSEQLEATLGRKRASRGVTKEEENAQNHDGEQKIGPLVARKVGFFGFCRIHGAKV